MNKPKDFNMEEFEKCYLENYKYLYTVEELGIEKEPEREAVSDFENRRYPDWLFAETCKVLVPPVYSDREIAAFMYAAEEMGYLK